MDKKEEILKAAIPIFAHKGFHGTSMEEVADAAGVAKGTLYLYFSGKAALFAETNIYMLSDTEKFLEDAMSQGDSLWEKIETMITKAIGFFADNKDAFNIFQRETPLESIAIDGGIADKIKSIMISRVDKLAGIFAHHRPEGELSDEFSDREAAFLCLNVMEGIIRRFLEGWDEDTEKNAQLALRFIKNGLSKNK